MKILPDESLPTKLSGFSGTGHEALTVKDMNWLGKKTISDASSLCLLTRPMQLPLKQYAAGKIKGWPACYLQKDRQFVITGWPVILIGAPVVRNYK